MTKPKAMFVTCASCGKRHNIETLNYVQNYWYERPWGCTGGATWHTSDSDSGFVCTCGIRNRLLPGRVHKAKHRFAKIVDEYGDVNGKWINSRMKPDAEGIK